MNEQQSNRNSIKHDISNLISWDKLIVYLLSLFFLFSIAIYNFSSISWSLPIIAMISSVGFSALYNNSSKNQMNKNLTLLPFSLVLALYILISPFLYFSFFNNINLFQVLILYTPFLIYVTSFKLFDFINIENKKGSDFINSSFIYCILVMLLTTLQQFSIEQINSFIVLGMCLFMLSTSYLFNFSRRPIVNLLAAVSVSAIFLEFWIIIDYFVLSIPTTILAGLIFFHLIAGLMDAELNKKLNINVILEYFILAVGSATILIYLENISFFQ
ncbi:MAG: hypothetical protein CL779_02995 [Chloroflexi bacterium]|nr:hypothetical protein [Chloroflexota bacterium]|tara:strand:- start:9876 stop:10691 length:816 start_codon:yes stop_codon:yes gene_type:complete